MSSERAKLFSVRAYGYGCSVVPPSRCKRRQLMTTFSGLSKREFLLVQRTGPQVTIIDEVPVGHAEP